LFYRPATDLTGLRAYGIVGPMKTAYLFPGQGAQYPGMGKDLWESSSRVKDLFRLASDVTKMPLDRLLFEGSEEDLRATDKAQAAITLVNLSAHLILRERGWEPDGAAGFSLGEFSALAAAGILTSETVFSLVKVRGDLMEKASRRQDDARGSAGMAAVIGLDFPDVVRIITEAKLEGLFPANYNSPAQTVVSGTAEALAKAEDVLKAAGARRVIRLKVSGPFHSPLLQEARAGFEEELARVDFLDPKIPVYSNVTGGVIGSGAEAKRLAGLQIVSPVLWVDVERAVKKDGYDTVLETGPGTVLSGLWKALYPETPCKAAGTIEDITNSTDRTG
jgi:[acyl-carrier-protein] S-malonyltransferase